MERGEARERAGRRERRGEASDGEGEDEEGGGGGANLDESRRISTNLDISAKARLARERAREAQAEMYALCAARVGATPDMSMSFHSPSACGERESSRARMQWGGGVGLCGGVEG